jgi:hypothetical protein
MISVNGRSKKQKGKMLHKITGNLTAEQQEALTSVKIYIGTPMSGGQAVTAFVSSYGQTVDFATRNGLSLDQLFLYNESLIPRGRDRIANHFLFNTDATHLLFIDADIRFFPEDVFSLALAKKGIIAGIYPMKTINYKRIIEAFQAGVPIDKLEHCTGQFFWRPLKGETMTVWEPSPQQYVGTGFLMIERQVLEAMTKVCTPYTPNYDNAKGPHYKFFPGDLVVNDEALSEDYSFCHRARQAGFDSYLAPWVTLTHTGAMEFKGCFWCSQGIYRHNICAPK